MASKIASSVGRKLAGNAAGNYVVETQDPHYETYTNDRGKARHSSASNSVHPRRSSADVARFLRA